MPSNKGQDSLRHSQNMTVAAMAMADMKVWAHRLMTPHTPPLQRPREPARVQRCEAAEPLPGEFQVCAPRKPAVLSLVPGASRRKADSRHVRSGWLADLGPRRDRLTIARPEASKVR